MIKVLHILSAVGSGGVETMLYNYYKTFNRAEICFDFVAHKGNSNVMAPLLEELGCKIFYITSQRQGIKKNQDELKKILSANDYNIIHVHHGILSLGIKTCRKYSPQSKIIVHSHGSNDSNLIVHCGKFILERYIRKYADYYCACSIKAANFAFGKKFTKKGKVKIIHNAIELDKFNFNQSDRLSIRENFNIGEREICVGVIGRLAYVKNPFFVLDIAKKLKKIGFPFKILWVGDGELLSKIKKRIKDLALENYVIFAGIQNDIGRFYSSFDIFLLPSKNEGLGIVAIEAQQNGVPVLLSDKVPNEVIISDRCKSLPLNIDLWCEEIIASKNRNCTVIDSNKSIANIDYDIKTESVKLFCFYRDICKK